MGRKARRRQKKNNSPNHKNKSTLGASPSSTAKPAVSNREVKRMDNPPVGDPSPTPKPQQKSPPSPDSDARAIALLEEAADVHKDSLTWPPFFDRGIGPIRFPYDNGGVPLLMLIVYMVFLGFTFNYIAQNLVPDYLNFFSK
jgi:hypothetical protein